MSASSPSRVSTAAAPVPTWRQWMRRLYLLAASLICICIVAQVFYVGAAVLVDPAYWSAHRALGHALSSAVIALALIGLTTSLPWRMQLLGLLLYVLMVLQYVFLHLMPSIGAPLLRSLHAVNALLLFSIALLLVRQIWQRLRS